MQKTALVIVKTRLCYFFMFVGRVRHLPLCTDKTLLKRFIIVYSKIFISMKRITLKLTFGQAHYLLNNLPAGHRIRVSGLDLDKIIMIANELKKGK